MSPGGLPGADALRCGLASASARTDAVFDVCRAGQGHHIQHPRDALWTPRTHLGHATGALIKLVLAAGCPHDEDVLGALES